MENFGYGCCRTITNTMQSHYETMRNHYEATLNNFINRETNAFAESSDAKIKAFRTQVQGSRKYTSLYVWIMQTNSVNSGYTHRVFRLPHYYLDREGIRETFFSSSSKLGVKIPLPRFSFISSIFQNRPPSSSSLGRISPS